MKTITKDDIVHDIAYSLMRFGKNDWIGTRKYLAAALEKLDTWLATRPEKIAKESRS